ncbi:MAG: site-specific integrase [Muribaculaceae bacterium]|nr:site-specific integrase [Muribaculaceae bacterium]
MKSTTVKISLRKSRNKTVWYLYLDCHPVIEAGKPARIRQSIGRTITTPIFINGQLKYDRNGVIQCSSNIDQECCRFAEGLRKKVQAEYDRQALMTDEEKAIAEQAQIAEGDFLDYMDYLMIERHRSYSASIRVNWKRAIELLSRFCQNKPLPLKKISVKLLNDFREFLLTAPKKGKKGTLSRNSAATYFSIVKAALKEAFREGYLPTDIAAKVHGIPDEESQREFLNIDELNLLVDTPCEMPVLKSAALFSALTGLRHSDIMKLTWGDIEDDGENSFLSIRQKKTKNIVRFPLSRQARELCGERQHGSNRVFEDLTPPSWISRPLKKWIEAAGITKHITFHCFRHTYATLQLAAGTDIYTVSKMLGHTNVRTTEIYTKLTDAKKQQAANAIQLNFNKNENFSQKG